MSSFFQFAFARSDGSTKFIVVQADGEEQVDCMKECVGRGVPNCILLAVFHNCENAILVNDAFTPTGFAEFMMDMAGFDSMPKGLQARVERAAGTSDEPVKALPGPEAAPAAGQTEKLTGALMGLGFGAPSVKKWVKSLGGRAETGSLPDLVKDGVKALVSANAN